MEKRPIPGVAFWVLTAAIGAVGYWLYQNHLTGDFKRTLTAACDGRTSESDQDRYLQSARAAARTKKDRQILGQFQHLVEINKDVNNYDHHVWDRLDADLRDVETSIPTPLHHLLALKVEYQQRHLSIPPSLQDDIARVTLEQQEESKRRHQQESIDKERTDQERKEVAALYKQIRAELGVLELP